jgi:hypothetical protein
MKSLFLIKSTETDVTQVKVSINKNGKANNGKTQIYAIGISYRTTNTKSRLKNKMYNTPKGEMVSYIDAAYYRFNSEVNKLIKKGYSVSETPVITTIK